MLRILHRFLQLGICFPVKCISVVLCFKKYFLLVLQYSIYNNYHLICLLGNPMRALLQLTIKDMSVVYNKSTGENYRQVKNYLSFFTGCFIPAVWLIVTRLILFPVRKKLMQMIISFVFFNDNGKKKKCSASSTIPRKLNHWNEILK